MAKAHYQIDTPAKINWFLDIVEKRADNYHNLSTLMQKISLHDSLYISFSKKTFLDLGLPFAPVAIKLGDREVFFSINSRYGLVADEKNTVICALASYLEAHFAMDQALPSEIYIHLEKKIPLQAGLGGGSANAAGILRILDILCHDLGQSPLGEVKLQQIAKRVGADVPFLLQSSARAYCEGIGDIISKRDTKIVHDVLLFLPNIQVSTKDAFALFAENGNREIAFFSDEKIFSVLLDNKRYNELTEVAQNTFYNLLVDKNPLLNTIYITLAESGAAYVAMSGSGASFFALYDSSASRQNAVSFLEEEARRELAKKQLDFQLIEVETLL